MEQNLVCFNTFGEKDSWTLDTYEKCDGYKAWRKILAGKMTPWWSITFGASPVLMNQTADARLPDVGWTQIKWRATCS